MYCTHKCTSTVTHVLTTSFIISNVIKTTVVTEITDSYDTVCLIVCNGVFMVRSEEGGVFFYTELATITKSVV